MWPLGLLAQPAKVPRVGLLSLGNPEPYWSYLRDAFRDAGYLAGKNIHLDFRSADGKPNVLAEHAAELARTKVDLIIAVQTPAVQAAMKATTAIPVVMIAGAPVETGVVASLNRPGGNVTGVSATGPELAAKTLEVMREIVPSLRRVAALINGGALGFGKPLLEQIQLASRALAIEVQPLIVRAPEELDGAFASMVKANAQAAVVQPSLPRARVLELALKHRVPTCSPNAGWTAAGAFMSYGPDLRELCRNAVGYADRIFKGSRPADLPVQQPTRFELLINQKTARAIGITVPPSVLLRADKVIE